MNLVSLLFVVVVAVRGSLRGVHGHRSCARACAPIKMSESDTKVEEPVEEGAEEEEEETPEEGEGGGSAMGGVVIQGGVGKKVRADLAARLKECDYSKESSQHRVYLFCNWNKEWDASVFGAPKTADATDLFLSTNIVPILLHDPSKGELAWGDDELGTFYDAVDLAKADLDDGKTVIVACVAGKNRSVAMERALTRCTVCKPSCDAMERAALGYLRDKDMRIVPLFPQPSKRKREDGP